MLKDAIEQVEYMRDLLDLCGMRERILHYIDDRKKLDKRR